MTGTHGTNHDEPRPRARRSRSRVGRFTPAFATLHLGALVGLLALLAVAPAAGGSTAGAGPLQPRAGRADVQRAHVSVRFVASSCGDYRSSAS